MLNPEGKTRETQIKADPLSKTFYNKADELEDAILFPEELSSKPSKALYKGKDSELEGFVNKPPAWE